MDCRTVGYTSRRSRRAALTAVAITCMLSVAPSCADSPHLVAATPSDPLSAPVGNNADPQVGAPQTDAIGLSLTHISVAPGDGYDRVTIQFSGPAAPGWDVRYVGQPVRISTNDPFPVAGVTILEVRLREAPNPFSTGAPPYTGPAVLPGPAGGSIAEVKLGGTFRNVTQAFIGTSRKYPPFRVTALESPPRIVVDIGK